MDLLNAWRASDAPPFILDDDRAAFDGGRGTLGTVVHKSWRDAREAPDFAAPGDARFHLGLLPQPFLGDLLRAEVYILLLNPGLGPADYFGEYEVTEYREPLSDRTDPTTTADDNSHTKGAV